MTEYMDYSDFLDAWCKRLGVKNSSYMDARGREHIICLTMFRAAGNEVEGVDQPPVHVKPSARKHMDCLTTCIVNDPDTCPHQVRRSPRIINNDWSRPWNRPLDFDTD